MAWQEMMNGEPKVDAKVNGERLTMNGEWLYEMLHLRFSMTQGLWAHHLAFFYKVFSPGQTHQNLHAQMIEFHANLAKRV